MRLVTRILTPLVFLSATLVPAGVASADPAESTRTETFAAVVNECNGWDHVGLEGTIQFVSKQQRDGSFIVHVTIQGQGLSSQGNEYVLIWTGRARPDTSTEDRILLVSKGSHPNQMLIFRYDPDTGSTFDADCRG